MISKTQRIFGNVLYHFDFNGDKLIIGKFCSIASDVKFIMNGGNHRTDWFTNYPFPIFGSGWEAAMPDEWPNKGDTLIGNDVWIDNHLVLGWRRCNRCYKVSLPRDVEAYTIVGGNRLKNPFAF